MAPKPATSKTPKKPTGANTPKNKKDAGKVSGDAAAAQDSDRIALEPPKTKEEALQEFLNSFEGTEGNRDSKVTLDEWVRHYEEVSSSIDSDDYFGTMMSASWSRLKQKMPNGAEVPAVKFTPRADVDLLEKQLRRWREEHHLTW